MTSMFNEDENSFLSLIKEQQLKHNCPLKPDTGILTLNLNLSKVEP